MHFYTALALLLSGMIGVSLGLMGGGGSILALPVLVYVAHVDPRQAVAMSLAIVGSTSLMAGLMHHRGGTSTAASGRSSGSPACRALSPARASRTWFRRTSSCCRSAF